MLGGKGRLTTAAGTGFRQTLISPLQEMLRAHLLVKLYSADYAMLEHKYNRTQQSIFLLYRNSSAYQAKSS